jgi:uncharacterized coiled-coil protein SlyX
MVSLIDKWNLYIGRTPQRLEQLKSEVARTKQEVADLKVRVAALEEKLKGLQPSVEDVLNSARPSSPVKEVKGPGRSR